jgi:hypothetical protein
VTSTGRNIRVVGTLLVSAHLGALVAHALSHTHLHVMAEGWRLWFIVIVIFVLPVLAAVLLWTAKQGPGLTVLFFSMVGSLVFGIYHHFVLPGPDNVASIGQGSWSGCFVASAVLLAVVEAATCIWCGFVPSVDRRRRAINSSN